MVASDMGFSMGPSDRGIVGETIRTRALNDAFRANMAQGVVVMTPQVQHLAEQTRHALVAAIGQFSDFPPGNDPYEEHDFGAVQIGNERYFWKIDYYDRDLRYASPDPGDPAVTIRVMTIMRADEY